MQQELRCQGWVKAVIGSVQSQCFHTTMLEFNVRVGCKVVHQRCIDTRDTKLSSWQCFVLCNQTEHRSVNYKIYKEHSVVNTNITFVNKNLSPREIFVSVVNI